MSNLSITYNVSFIQGDTPPEFYSFTESAIELDPIKKSKGLLLPKIKESLFSCILGLPSPETQGHMDYLEQLAKRGGKRRKESWRPRHVTITYIE